MPLNAGSSVYGQDGSVYRLSQEIGAGGQGSVWSLDGEPMLVAKFYHNPIGSRDLSKLQAMCKIKSDALARIAAWPLTLLRETRAGEPRGLLMRRISGHYSVHQLYGLKSRLNYFPEAQFPFLLHTAINAARAFATIHGAGQVVGDVNHSNLMVSQSATVSIIDCDSFQIAEGSDVYLCPVGVPEFTPPELQGISFGTQRRTPQHDAFGLSVLLFYLLFLGRHPFMGLYDPQAGDIVAIDRAIAAYKFPYALGDQSPEVRLPPFVPRLSDYPAGVGALFKRAFTREAVVSGRPSAQEWVACLEGLSSTTRQCTANPNHSYYREASACPWCRVEGAIGTAVFGIKVRVIRDDHFNLVAAWAEIEGIKPVLELLSKPDLASVVSQYSADPSIGEIIGRRRLFRLGAIALVLPVSIWAVVSMSAVPAIMVIIASLIAGRYLWSRGEALSAHFAASHSQAMDAYKNCEQRFNEATMIPEAFASEMRLLVAAKAEYQGLAGEKARRLAALEARRELMQLQHHLEKYRIEDHEIPNIGPKNKLVLKVWGIEDAWDVKQNRVEIKGFGPVRKLSLKVWSEYWEKQFKFDPKQSLDPRDIAALEQEFAQRSNALKGRLIAGPQKLRQILAVREAQRRNLLASLFAAANQLAKAAVNQKALRTF